MMNLALVLTVLNQTNSDAGVDLSFEVLSMHSVLADRPCLHGGECPQEHEFTLSRYQGLSAGYCLECSDGAVDNADKELRSIP